MALTLLGVLTVDQDSAALSLNAPEKAYLLTAKDTGGEYRTLQMDEQGEFFGDVQIMLEDDVLEGYLPDFSFFKQHLGESYKALSRLLLYNAGDFPEGLNKLLNALLSLAHGTKLTPGDHTVSSGDLELVRQMLRDIDPKNPGFEFVYALANAAIQHRKNKNYDQAIYYYMKAIDIGGEDPNILFNLARVYQEIGTVDRAKETLKRALQLDPTMKMARQFLNFLTNNN
jgi:tetratricopeptide (TPR) repeat protein